MSASILHRPIAVTMCVIAVAVLGCVAIRFIPVSLMPDIDIPQITVQVSCPGYSAAEAENKFTSLLRGQLMQVGQLQDIRSESRADAGSIVLTFEPGADMNILFIEVNEKIDRAMNHLPRDAERPKVIKAGAMDIPAFYLDMWLKPTDSKDAKDGSGRDFAELGRFARGVVSKRIEQLPQTAMVDMSGTVGSEIVVTPKTEKMQPLGLTVNDIEKAILSNDITLEALSVASGIYRYHIHFDSQLLTKDDIADIYVNHDGRILQLRDICDIEEHMQQANGIVRHNGHRAITMAVIKQTDAQMDDLKESMEQLTDNLRREFPKIEFSMTRDQTQLLSFTIDNLKNNLYAGAALACLILLLFMRQWRLSLLIAGAIPLSLIVTLLAFYATGISLNIISLSGLILGVGMIVDNAIIVTDNIMRRWREGERLDEAAVKGVREVFAPMLSSVLTTCSIFLPLIFLSGTAGALFFDQAMGITFSLFASLLTAAVVIPVYFYALFRNRKSCNTTNPMEHGMMSRLITMPYEKGLNWVMRHSRACCIFVVCTIPLTGCIVWTIEKQRMPSLPEHDALMNIDWNSSISPAENDNRTTGLMKKAGNVITDYTLMAGTQDFMLAHTRDITSSEAIIYIKAETAGKLEAAKQTLRGMVEREYPEASVDFENAANIYSLMFSTDEADLEIHLQDADGHRPDIAASRAFTDTLRAHFPNIGIMPVVTESNICYMADMEQMILHKVPYDKLHTRMRQLMNRSRIADINDGAQSVPILLSADRRQAQDILSETVTNDEGTDIPIHLLVRETKGENYKRLQAAAGGGFYSINIKAPDKDVERIMAFTDQYVRQRTSHFTATYTGGYFSSRQLIGELTIVLCVAMALLYFILAAQFESLLQPLIILSEMVVDLFFVIFLLWILGVSLNVMSMIGLVVMSGIVINDSILKVDAINRLRREGKPLVAAIVMAGHRKLSPIIMTSLTTIFALIPFLSQGDIGSALQYPMSVTLVVGMTVGTGVSLFFVPLVYYGFAKIRKAQAKKHSHR